MGDMLDALTNIVRQAGAATEEHNTAARQRYEDAMREYNEAHPTPDMIRVRQAAAREAQADEREQQGKGMQELLARTNQTGQALRLRAAGIDPSEVDNGETA